MGLDSVELVMAIEESLGIRFPDEQIVRVRTVGDLHKIIVDAHPTAQANSNICLSAATFRLVRRIIQPDVETETRRLRPRDALEPVLPRVNRRAIWSRWQMLHDLKFPSLVRPKWLVNAATIVTLAGASVCAYQFFAVASFGSALVAGAVALLPIGLLLARLTTPFAVHPGDSFRTCGGLARVVLAHNLARLSERFGTRNSADIWNVLQLLIVEQLGVSIELVTPDARFVEDLGMD